jgi:hypothetical protein
LDSFEKKSSQAFGKAVGDTIYSEWFYKGSGSCRFYTNRAEFQEREPTLVEKLIWISTILNLELMEMFVEFK